MTTRKAMTGIGAAAALFVAQPAVAQNAGAIAESLTGQMTSGMGLLTILTFVAGAAVGLAGLLKFKACKDNPNDPSNKMSSAWTMIFVGAGLVALPAVLGSGIGTIFGDGAQMSNAEGGDGFSTIELGN